MWAVLLALGKYSSDSKSGQKCCDKNWQFFSLGYSIPIVQFCFIYLFHFRDVSPDKVRDSIISRYKAERIKLLHKFCPLENGFYKFDFLFFVQHYL